MVWQGLVVVFFFIIRGRPRVFEDVVLSCKWKFETFNNWGIDEPYKVAYLPVVVANVQRPGVERPHACPQERFASEEDMVRSLRRLLAVATLGVWMSHFVDTVVLQT